MGYLLKDTLPDDLIRVIRDVQPASAPSRPRLLPFSNSVPANRR